MTANAKTIEFGSTDHGFVPRQLADIQIALNEAAALITDPRTGERPFQNATDDAILQQIFAKIAEQIAYAENAAHDAFYGLDPLTAVGAQLEGLVQLNGITKNSGEYTLIPLVWEGMPGTLIPAGTVVGPADGVGINYIVLVDTIIPLSRTVTTTARASEYGEFDPAPDTITRQVTSVPNIASVTNGETMSIGVEEESDAVIRRRQQLSTNATSYRQIEAIDAAVRNVEGVTFARTYQNRGLLPDQRGIPGKTIASVAVGGDSRKIAEAILMRSPEGVGFHGNTHETFLDRQGIATTVSLTRPFEKPVIVRLQIEIVTDEGIHIFPSNGIALIKKAIVDFARQGHTVCEPLGNPGFPPGQDIIRSQLFTPINSIGGARIISLELAFEGGNLAEQDLVVAWNEVGIFSEENIEVILP